MSSQPRHPYFPPSLALPGYVAADSVPGAMPRSQVCYVAAAVVFGLALFATVFARCLRLPGLLHNAFVWLFVAAPLELGMSVFLLGNYGSVHRLTSFPAEVWKEYARADSRVLTGKDNLVYYTAVINGFILAPYMILQILKMIFSRGRPHSVLGCLIAISAAYVTSIVIYMLPVLHLPGGFRVFYTHYEFENLGHFAHAAAHFFNFRDSLANLRSSTSSPRPQIFWGYFIGLNLFRVFMPVVMLLWAPAKISRAFSGQRLGGSSGSGGGSGGSGGSGSGTAHSSGSQRAQSQHMSNMQSKSRNTFPAQSASSSSTSAMKKKNN